MLKTIVRMSDPRRRKARHDLTPDNLSYAIQVTNLPTDWTQDTVSSVLAGSGPVVEISSKTDPRTGKLSSLRFDYKSSKDCKSAFDILNRIQNFPCTLERIIPPNYKDMELLSNKEELQLNRDAYPWNAGLDLPFDMVSEVPLPRKPTQTSPATTNSVVFPDILSKASQHLPPFQPNVLQAPDLVSTNLSKIPPLQLIEIISNLKILANQDSSKRTQLENFLKTNMEISVSVTQALLEMGFINYNVVTNVLKGQPKNDTTVFHSNTTNGTGNSNSNSVNNSSSNTPLYANSNVASLSSVPVPAAFVPPMPQHAQRPPFGFVPPPMPFMPPNPVLGMAPSNPMMRMSPPHPVINMPQSTVAQNSSGRINMAKLQALPQNQRETIETVLKLTLDQINALPANQKSMVENLKKEYTL